MSDLRRLPERWAPAVAVRYAARPEPDLVVPGTGYRFGVYDRRALRHDAELLVRPPPAAGAHQIAGDAWNGEDHSVVAVDTGGPALRLAARVLDRLSPSAVDGQVLAFGYEDRARR